MICKNCGNEVTDKYCSHCGQVNSTSRLSVKELLWNFWDVFTHAESGIIKAISLLTLKPDYVAKEYISGKRKKYFSPVKYLIVVVTLSALLILNYSRMGLPFEPAFPSDSQVDDVVEQDYFNHNNYKPQLFLSIPLVSLISFLMFRRYGFNYAENLVINTYLFAQVILFHTVLITPSLILTSASVDQWLILFYLAAASIYIVFAYTRFFGGNKSLNIIKALLTLVIFSVVYNYLSHSLYSIFS